MDCTPGRALRGESPEPAESTFDPSDAPADTNHQNDESGSFGCSPAKNWEGSNDPVTYLMDMTN
jgi:hypothetical protein